MKEWGKSNLRFEKDYFERRKYSQKEALVTRHVLEVIKWASKLSNSNLLAGSGRKALDVGCAYGYSSRVLESLSYETYGLDVSSWGVKAAKRDCEGSFLVCSAQSWLPFRESSFDLVTCFDVLEHLSSPIEALRNMLSVSCGFVVCTTPNKTVEKSVRKITRDLDETHISVKSPSEWERSITENTSYNLLRVETYYDLSARVAGRLLFRSFKMPKLGLTVRLLIKK